MCAPDLIQPPHRLRDRTSTCAAGSTWEWWMGGIPSGDVNPLDDLGFFDQWSCISSLLLDFPVLFVCTPPTHALPFPVKPYVSPTPSLQTGGVFCGRSSWSPSAGLLDLVTLPVEPGNIVYANCTCKSKPIHCKAVSYVTYNRPRHSGSPEHDHQCLKNK